MKSIKHSALLLHMLVFALALSACAGGGSEEMEKFEAQVYDSLTLKITPGMELTQPIAVTQGALIRISVKELTPEVRFHMFLGSPGTEYKDPVASGKTDTEGKTGAIFNIPQKWDDGQPITQDRLLLIAEWGDDAADSVTVEIGYILDE